MDAPVLVAKGADLMAKRIREIAKEHNVPIMENPPLARTLYDKVELDSARSAEPVRGRRASHRVHLQAQENRRSPDKRPAAKSIVPIPVREAARRPMAVAAAPANEHDRIASPHRPIWVAGASVMLVVLMIVPIPPWLLDILLSVNITLALVIMLTTLYTENALAFRVFPTLLLIITLFRLSLNISATRSILLHGYAGEVIELVR